MPNSVTKSYDDGSRPFGRGNRGSCFGPERARALHYAIGAAFIALIAFVVMPYALLLAVIFLAGLTIIGSQTGLSDTVRYPWIGVADLLHVMIFRFSPARSPSLPRGRPR